MGTKTILVLICERCREEWQPEASGVWGGRVLIEPTNGNSADHVSRVETDGFRRTRAPIEVCADCLREALAWWRSPTA